MIEQLYLIFGIGMLVGGVMTFIGVKLLLLEKQVKALQEAFTKMLTLITTSQSAALQKELNEFANKLKTKPDNKKPDSEITPTTVEGMSYIG